MTDKVTQQVMFSSKTELWETPQDLFDKLNEEYHFPSMIVVFDADKEHKEIKEWS